MNKTVMMLGLVLVASQVNAEDTAKKNNFDTKDIYFGGGLGMNDANFGDDATGFQLFLGMPLPIKADTVKIAAEVGYMDSGDFDKDGNFFVPASSSKANGLWGTAVASLPIQDGVDLIGRVGLDFGDDDGLMVGIGVGFEVNNDMELRVEYVARDHIDSLQLNLVIR